MEDNNHSNTLGKILVVDDDSSILEAIQILLEYEGYAVCTAHDAKTALKVALTKKPHLVVLDVLLSGDDGRDIAKRLKTTPMTQQIPILMMSAHLNIRQSVIEAGADEFIPKPFDIDVLLRFVEHYTKDFIYD